MIAAHTVFDVDAVGRRVRAGAAEGRRAVTAVDTEHRRLCHTLFDAIERGDIDAVDRCYAPEMTMWFNVTGKEIGREENLAALGQGRDLHRRRTYNDRIISTFDDGFVVQYTMNVVTHDGHEGAAVGLPRRRGARREDHEALRVPRLGEVPGVADGRVRDPRAVRGVLRRLREPARRRPRAAVRRRLHRLAQRVRTRHDRRREPRRAARRLQGPAPAHLQRPDHQHVRRRLRHPVLAQRRAAQRAPRCAVDLHRRPVSRREDHPHRRVHGLGQVRGVGRAQEQGGRS